MDNNPYDCTRYGVYRNPMISTILIPTSGIIPCRIRKASQRLLDFKIAEETPLGEWPRLLKDRSRSDSSSWRSSSRFLGKSKVSALLKQGGALTNENP